MRLVFASNNAHKLDEVRRILQETDLNTLTPIEAMNLLFDLQKKARG